MNEDVKLCSNCRHRTGELHALACRLTAVTSLVDGVKIFQSCKSERANTGYCGVEGRRFEARESL